MICAGFLRPLLLLFLFLFVDRAYSEDNGVLQLEDRFNYASFDCAARILSTNPGAKSAHSILSPHARDSYLRNLCSFPSKFVVIELCQDVRVDTIVLGNHEYFSSTFRDVEVAVSKCYPPKGGESGWRLLGKWEAVNKREDQVFRVPPNPNAIFARFLRVKLLSHYGNEYYCPVSVIKVYGKTMIDDFEESKSKDAEDAKDSFVVVTEDEQVVVKAPKQVKKETTDEAVCPVTITFTTATAATMASVTTKTASIFDHHSNNGTSPISSQVGLQVFRAARPPLCPIDYFDDDFLALDSHLFSNLDKAKGRKAAAKRRRRRRKKKTIVYPQVCLNQRILDAPMCSSKVKCIVVFEEEKADEKAQGGEAGGEKENIFKSIHDRLDRLESGSQYLREATGTSMKRLESQIRRLRIEVDIGRDESDGEDGLAYRVRLRHSLFRYLRGRLDKVQGQLAKDLKVLRAFEGALFYLVLLTLINLVFMLVGLYALYQARPSRHNKTDDRSTGSSNTNTSIATPEIGMQQVPEKSNNGLLIGGGKPVVISSSSLGDTAMMIASPLLLFDPETDLVDRIYPGSPSQDEHGEPSQSSLSSSETEAVTASHIIDNQQ